MEVGRVLRAVCSATYAGARFAALWAAADKTRRAIKYISIQPAYSACGVRFYVVRPSELVSMFSSNKAVAGQNVATTDARLEVATRPMSVVAAAPSG